MEIGRHRPDSDARDGGESGVGLGLGGIGGAAAAGREDSSKELRLSVREATLWGKLSELRDLPVQDSLAAFPAELGERKTGAIEPISSCVLSAIENILTLRTKYVLGEENVTRPWAVESSESSAHRLHRHIC